MICILLCAGYATRLYPLTQNFPKPLLKVGDKTIVDHILCDLEDIPQITGYVIISNHKFIDHFKKWESEQAYKKPITILDDGSTDNDNRLGAVNDIKFAVESLNITQDVLVVAGDNVLDFSLKSFVEFAIDKNAPCVMCSEENDLQKQRKTAIITRADDGLITSYEEKPKEPKGNLAVPPFYYYRAQDVAMIDSAITEGCNTDAPGSFAAWISTKTPTYALTIPGKRYDIGDMASYELAQKIFRGSK